MGGGGLWDKDGGWHERGVGVNMVMISLEFRSYGPMRGVRDREGEKGERESSCCPVTTSIRNCGDTSSTSQQGSKARGMLRENRNADTHLYSINAAHAHTHTADSLDTSHRPISVQTEARGIPVGDIKWFHFNFCLFEKNKQKDFRTDGTRLRLLLFPLNLFLCGFMEVY